MKKEQLLGLIREILTAVGAGLVTFGVQAPQVVIESVIGALMVLAGIGWALYANEGTQTIFTLFRKLLSAGGGVAVAFGLMTPEKVEALLGALGPIIALVWSIHSKGGTLPPITSAIMLFLALGSFGLTSCAIELTPDGCVLGTYSKSGYNYKAGPCMGEDGEIDRARIQWETPDDQLVRATFFKENMSAGPLVEYRTKGGIWIEWSAKSGVIIGPIPPGLDEAITNPGTPIDLEAIEDAQLRADLGELY